MTTSNNTIPGQQVIKKLWSRKYLFLKVWIITFALSAAYIVPQPRLYSASTMLAPEMGGTDQAGGLSALASSFGFNLGGGSSADAIYPSLYPDLISSNTFIVSLFDIQVQTLDGSVKTDLYTYLSKHQKSTFYKKPYFCIKRKLKSLTDGKRTSDKGGDGTVNPSFLSEQQFYMVERLKGSIICTVDPLSNVISLRVSAQDPLVAACLADSVCMRLQKTITDYRTSKSRVDVEYYAKLVEASRKDYVSATKAYADFCDSHKNLTRQAVLSERDKLEMELSMALNKYQAMTTQLENANAKLQEVTPVFTTLQNASVPLLPYAPKRAFFCMAMLLLATLITTCRILKDEMYSTIVFFSSKKQG